MIELKNGAFYNSDCLEVMKNFSDQSVDMILTDPPYSMGYLLNWKRGKRKKQVDKIRNDDNLTWLEPFVLECFRLSKNNTAHYCFCSYHKIDIFKQTFEKYFSIKNILTWVKHDTGMGDIYHNFAPKTEFILFFQKGKRKINGNRSPNYLTFHATHNPLHPTQKPVDLFEFLIKKFSNENDLIFDPFAGSGTTAIAAINTNRRWICIESEKVYYDIAVNRINSGIHIKSPYRLFKDYQF